MPSKAPVRADTSSELSDIDDAQAITNGTVQPRVTTEEVKAAEKQITSGITKRKRVSIEEDRKPVDGGSPKKVRHTKKINEKTQILFNEESPQNTKRKAKTTLKQEAAEDTEAQEEPATPKKRGRKTKVEVEEKTVGDDAEEETATSKYRVRKAKAKVEQRVAEDGEGAEDADTPKKTKRKRKTKEEKEAEAMPLASRTPGLNMLIGAHVSCAKGSLDHRTCLCVTRPALTFSVIQACTTPSPTAYT